MIGQTPADALEEFLRARPLMIALRDESRVAQLADERLASSPDGSVVYLLVDGSGHVLYIGRSRAWRKRASAHSSGWIGAVVDHVRVISMRGRLLDGGALETALIEILQPPYNRAGTSHGLDLPRILHRPQDEWMGGRLVREIAAGIDQRRLAWQSGHPPTFPPEGVAA